MTAEKEGHFPFLCSYSLEIRDQKILTENQIFVPEDLASITYQWRN